MPFDMDNFFANDASNPLSVKTKNLDPKTLC